MQLFFLASAINQKQVRIYCSFRQTGRRYLLQFLFHCKTCGLTGNKGCCGLCIAVFNSYFLVVLLFFFFFWRCVHLFVSICSFRSATVATQLLVTQEKRSNIIVTVVLEPVVINAHLVSALIRLVDTKM